MDKTDAYEVPPTLEDDAAAPVDVWSLVKTSLGDVFRMPRLGRRGVAALVGVVIAAWLSTALYRVQPDEKGVVLRFGKWVETTDPGLHMHLPYPIDAVLLPKVTKINQIQLGVDMTTTPGDAQSNRGRQMLTGDENIVEADCTVFWKIRDAGQFLFRVDNPELAVRIAAEGALRDVISRTPIQAAMSDKRQQIADQTQALLQSLLDGEHAGVEITQVQLQRVEPPLAVIDAFNDVQRARADQERARNEAEAYANDILPKARGDGRAHAPGRRSLQGPGRQSRPRRRRRFPAAAEELRVGEGRDSLAALSGQRRRDAEEGLEGRGGHLRQGRVERRSLHAGDRVQAGSPARRRPRRQSFRRGRRNEKPLACGDRCWSPSRST